MGNTESHQTLTTYQDPFNLEEFTKIQQCFVDSLGEIHELTNTLTKDSVFLKRIKLEPEILQRNIDELHHKFRTSHPNLLKTHASSFSQKHFKDQTYTEAMIYFESPVKSLHDEIFTRRQTQERFPAMELLVYLKNCIDVFALLEERGCVYDQITPHTIFFCKSNQVKIIHPTLIGLVDFSESLRFETNKEIKKLMCVEIARHLNFTPKSIKSSVFTLGVTFLASALLEEENMLYQSPDNPQHEKFKVYNAKLRTFYPSDFVNILRHMLDDDEAHRPSFVQLRDSLVEYMKSDALDNNQFPMSPTIQTGKRKARTNQFSDSFNFKLYKTSFSNSNTLGSPQNELANSRGPPEWSYKYGNNQTGNAHSKSFLDKLFCGFCSNNAEEEIEVNPIAMASRPTRKQEIMDLAAKSIDNPRESLQFNTEAFEGLVKETSQINQKTIPTVLTTDRFEKHESPLRTSECEEMPQVRLITPNIEVIDYGNRTRQPGMKQEHLKQKNLDRQSPNFSESPQKNEPVKKTGLYRANDRENQEIYAGPQTVRKGEGVSGQSLTYRDVNTTKMPMYNSSISSGQKVQIQGLNKKKKSALVKQIINDYKKNANNQAKIPNDISRIPLEEIKTNTFSRFLESHEKPLQAHNKSLYDDELFNSNEKSKLMNTLSQREKDMTRRNNLDGEGIFIEPEDSVYGIESKSRLSRTRNRRSLGHSHFSSPYKDGDTSYRSAGIVVTRNECPSCNAPFMSVNRSFGYSLATDRVHQHEREDAMKTGSGRRTSVRWNLGAETNSGDKKYSSPSDANRQRSFVGHQNTIQMMGLSSV